MAYSGQFLKRLIVFIFLGFRQVYRMRLICTKIIQVLVFKQRVETVFRIEIEYMVSLFMIRFTVLSGAYPFKAAIYTMSSVCTVEMVFSVAFMTLKVVFWFGEFISTT